ncbi:hypothetical protein E4656_00470 [Natronospirillum operosum]|uniref:MobA-like NTP transferase domain-containing protein n=1 Tax=Natronospirillum operosum TaxID=2759953 RepID=A0A4Z0WD34_9GAMM|nr:NTP transferase domain-containing protein [Natronospirillum operosum]TGG94940.1 hypothetical protein E4656_00470 [Natronospirillum operosum]
MQAVIPVAGQGSRLSAVTAGQPKALLTVGTMTLVEHALTRALELGSTELLLVVRDPVVEAHLGSRFADHPLTYVRQSSATGLGAAMRCAADQLRDPHFLLICGDIWCSQPLSSEVREAFRSGTEMLDLVTARALDQGLPADAQGCSTRAQGCSTHAQGCSAGIHVDQGGLITQVDDPPALQAVQVETGIYRFPQEVLRAPVTRAENGEESLQSMTRWLIDQGWPCRAVSSPGPWINVNTPAHLTLARELAARAEA